VGRAAQCATTTEAGEYPRLVDAERKEAQPVALSRAIGEWEQDLTFLYERYYLGLFRFGWPDTEPFDA
jgi:hypothetical protein